MSTLTQTGLQEIQPRTKKNRGHFILIVAGNYSLNSLELEDLSDVSGKSLLHLQCHFGMDSLSWAWSEASPSAS